MKLQHRLSKGLAAAGVFTSGILLTAPAALAQEKQHIRYQVSAENH
jgi:hypothetical protein